MCALNFDDGGQIQSDRVKLQQSPGLSSLRLTRRTTVDPDARRLLSLEIRKRQRLEIQVWKTDQVNRRLAQMTDWKYLKYIEYKNHRLMNWHSFLEHYLQVVVM